MINNILNNTVGMRILVIENEIGSEGIDNDLLVQQTGQEDIILLNNGCVCCTVRKDLISTFRRIFNEEKLMSKLNWVIIETTGLADPAPLIQTIYMDAECQKNLRLDSVITIIDSKHFSHHVSPNIGRDDNYGGHTSSDRGLLHGNIEISEAIQQVVYADRILLNKSDLVSAEELSLTKNKIELINSQADILTCSYGTVDVEMLLNIRAFDPLKNVALLCQESKVKPLKSLKVPKISSDTSSLGKDAVNSQISSASSKLTTISLTTTKALDLNRLNAWIASLLEFLGKDMYRLKGVLNVRGYDEMFVAHGVHMIFDGQRGKLWPKDAVRVSKFVIIGIDLDEETLKRDFKACCVE